MDKLAPTLTTKQAGQAFRAILRSADPPVIGPDEGDIAARLSRDADALTALLKSFDFPHQSWPYVLALLAISGGRRGWLEAKDKWVARRAGVNERTVRRWREPLLDYLREGGRPIIEVEHGWQRPGPEGTHENKPTKVNLTVALDLLCEAFRFARSDVRIGGDERSRGEAWEAAIRRASEMVDCAPTRPVRPKRKLSEAEKELRELRAIITQLERISRETGGLDPESNPRYRALREAIEALSAIIGRDTDGPVGGDYSYSYNSESDHPEKGTTLPPPQGPAPARDEGGGEGKMSAPSVAFYIGVELPQTLPEGPQALRVGNPAEPGPLGGGARWSFP